MARRIQSPSSINTYKQCPRKYYYIYIKKLKTLPSIHLIRGSIVHSVLEDFFKIDIDKLPESDIELLLKGLLKDFLMQKWNSAKNDLEQLDMTEAQRLFYYEETEQMICRWIDNLIAKLSKKPNFKDEFKRWTPRTEEEFISNQYQVKGFIDAIHELEDDIIVMDYKTSKKDVVTPEYTLQLAIYALLYQEKYGKLPTKAGINFLKFGERMIDVNEELLKLAKFEIEQIHASTESDSKEDYVRKPTPLCKWHSGQCDFYELCYNQNGSLKEE